MFPKRKNLITALEGWGSRGLSNVSPSTAQQLFGISRIVILVLATLSFVVSAPSRAEAETGERATLGKTLTYSLEPSSSALKDPYRLDLAGTLNRIVNFTADTNLFDPFTVAELERAASEASPRYDGWDDADKLRQVTERAFGLTAAQNIVRALETSDLRPTYLALKDSMRTVQRSVNYSVQTNGDEIAVGRAVKGRKLVELEIEFNARRLIDPHIKIGKHLRVRYDPDNSGPMLEYEIRY